MKEVIQKIKHQYNIVDYIRMSGVELQPSGHGSYKGLCPFHNEKTPSFSVSEDFQNYRCFGCGESGDIISFAQHIHTIEFMDAVKMLATEKGIELNESVNQEAKHDLNGIRRVLEDAADFFRYQYQLLDNSHPAKKEVEKRGLKIDNDIYGYSLETPNDLYKFLKSKGHSDKNIKESNLVIFFDEPNRQPWDFFHGRLMITLSDYLGRPVSFTSRKIYEHDKMPGKYVNGKDSPIFHKKGNLFGAGQAKRSARENKVVYVVEGQFDRIALAENGIENVVATSGTAFTSDHTNILRRMVGNDGRIVFVMDGDDAGIEAAIGVFTSEPSLHSQAYAVHLHEGADPCDYIVNGRLSELVELMENAVPLHDFVVDMTLKRMGGTITPSNRQEFASQIAGYAKSANDSFIVDRMLGKASILSAISIDNIREIYNKVEGPRKFERKEEASVVNEIKPLIQLNVNNEADMLMFSALSLLVRAPHELIPQTPKAIHNKFKPFLHELGAKYVESVNTKSPWRFIPEDYTDKDFAIALQNKEFLSDPKDDIEAMISQYLFLFNKANEIYQADYEKMIKAKALSSVVDTTDPKEIAEALRLYQKARGK